MANPNSIFVYVGTYPSEAAARDDHRVVKELYGDHTLGESALIVVAASPVAAKGAS